MTLSKKHGISKGLRRGLINRLIRILARLVRTCQGRPSGLLVGVSKWFAVYMIMHVFI